MRRRKERYYYCTIQSRLYVFNCPYGTKPSCEFSEFAGRILGHEFLQKKAVQAHSFFSCQRTTKPISIYFSHSNTFTIVLLQVSLVGVKSTCKDPFAQSLVIFANQMYRIVASKTTHYYSENQMFCLLKSRILTCRNFFRNNFVFVFEARKLKFSASY